MADLLNSKLLVRCPKLTVIASARYGNKRQKTAVGRFMGRIGGGIRGCCRRIKSNGDSDGGEDDDGRVMGGSSYGARNRFGLRPRFPRSSGRKRSRGTSASGASTTRSRSGLRSGSGSRLCRRRL